MQELTRRVRGSMLDQALARGVAKRLRPVREEASPGESQGRLLGHRDQIQAWLQPEDGGRGLRLSKVHELLTRQGVDVPCRSLHRFAVAHCGFADRRLANGQRRSDEAAHERRQVAPGT